MANKFTRFLSGAASGALNPKGNMGNWTHATRVFVDNTFRLSPRNKFLFYVHFEIDNTAHKSSVFTNRHGSEAGILVKRADLPKYQFDTETLNQYNRKKIIYKQIQYNTLNIGMHDDSAGVTNALWALYYGYYIADRQLPSSAYESNHYRPTNTDKDKFRYGLDNNISTPFLKSISIYTMSRKRFLGYTLVNPRIISWNHSDLAYGDLEFAESTMSVDYEAVRYSAGGVTYNNPKGFAELHYDTLPSPLSVAGGGTSTLLGPGGVLDGISGILGRSTGQDGLEAIFGDNERGEAFGNPQSFLSTTIQAINTYKNLKDLTSAGVRNEIIGAVTSPSVINGVVGSIFSRPQIVGDETTSTAKTLVQRNGN